MTLSLLPQGVRKQVTFLLQTFQKGSEWFARMNQDVIEILSEELTKEYLTEM